MPHEQRYRAQSFWLDSLPDTLAARAPLSGDLVADVVVIGAGYTGLWTAYYLNLHAPELDVVVLEAEIAGYGASGRNGGWCTSYLSKIDVLLEHPETRQAAVDLQRMMFDTVDEVGKVAAQEAIDCHYDKGGHVASAENQAQLRRDREEVQWWHDLGFGEDDIRWLEPREVHRHIRFGESLGGFFMNHCAAIHPARLARGLADAVERKGVKIFEQTPALAIDGSVVRTPAGNLNAETVLLATEGFSGSLPGLKRKLVPFHSTMIATEPLTDRELEASGLNRRLCFNNGKHLVTYGQLTADRRIAFGHRGRYLYGGGIQTEFSRTDPAFLSVERELKRMLPALEDKRITHAWGGPMGVSRTLRPAVCFDAADRRGWSGGFFGDGVGATNLAGRTLADLVLGRDTDRSRALWVNPPVEKDLHRKLWEPEPLRWVGVAARYRLMSLADSAEQRNGKFAPAWNWMLDALVPRFQP
jgi:glycine/D-amino acid oxidase-like deaminating enzyme